MTWGAEGRKGKCDGANSALVICVSVYVLWCRLLGNWPPCGDVWRLGCVEGQGAK